MGFLHGYAQRSLTRGKRGVVPEESSQEVPSRPPTPALNKQTAESLCSRVLAHHTAKLSRTLKHLCVPSPTSVIAVIGFGCPGCGGEAWWYCHLSQKQICRDIYGQLLGPLTSGIKIAQAKILYGMSPARLILGTDES